MESWLNFRLPDVESKLILQKYPLVLCHLDLAPRNIIWLADGSVCFIDWASAGFYPRFFEVCLLKIMEYSHGNYEVALIERMMKLSEDEETQMILLQRSFYNNIKYSFVSLSLLSATPYLLILAKSLIHETLA
jgi:thiamine kinase-like enzyme